MSPTKAKVTFPSGKERQATIEPGWGSPVVCGTSLAQATCSKDDTHTEVDVLVKPTAWVRRREDSLPHLHNRMQFKLEDGESVDIIEERRVRERMRVWRFLLPRWLGERVRFEKTVLTITHVQGGEQT